jgi:hypothetical protein
LKHQVARVLTGLQFQQQVHHMSPFDASNVRDDAREQLKGRHMDHGQLLVGTTDVFPAPCKNTTSRGPPSGVDPVESFLVLGHEGDQYILRILREWLPRAGVNSGKKISTSRGSDQGGRPIVIIIVIIGII